MATGARTQLLPFGVLAGILDQFSRAGYLPHEHTRSVEPHPSELRVVFQLRRVEGFNCMVSAHLRWSPSHRRDAFSRPFPRTRTRTLQCVFIESAVPPGSALRRALRPWGSALAWNSTWVATCGAAVPSPTPRYRIGFGPSAPWREVWGGRAPPVRFRRDVARGDASRLPEAARENLDYEGHQEDCDTRGGRERACSVLARHSQRPSRHDGRASACSERAGDVLPDATVIYTVPGESPVKARREGVGAHVFGVPEGPGSVCGSSTPTTACKTPR